MDIKAIIALKKKINEVFTPSAPIDRAELLAGRKDQLNRLLKAIFQKGQHAILYGERGVGKTSLATTLHEHLGDDPAPGDDPYLISSMNCEKASTFSSIWKSILRNMSFREKITPIGYAQPEQVREGNLSEMTEDLTTAEDVRYFFDKFGKPFVAIIDEVDQLETEGTAKSLADTIKTLSDHAVPITIVLVGVADSVDELIAEHISIERALVQIQMPRMSDDELLQIVRTGLQEVGMTAPEEAMRRISKLSLGLPHYTHLLALNTAETAADAGRLGIENKDLDEALKKSVDQAQQSIVSGYVRATTSRRGNLYPQVLTACALAPKDVFGFFAATDVSAAMSVIMRKPTDVRTFNAHLKDFCEDERGPVLERTGSPRRYRFRFCNPLMAPYVIMAALSKNLISQDEISTLQQQLA